MGRDGFQVSIRTGEISQHVAVADIQVNVGSTLRHLFTGENAPGGFFYTHPCRRA